MDELKDGQHYGVLIAQYANSKLPAGDEGFHNDGLVIIYYQFSTDAF